MPNKTTTLLKDAILMAATNAGGKDGLVGYLTTSAKKTRGPFLTLLGKVLPTQINGSVGVYDLSKLTDEQLERLESILSPLALAGGHPDGASQAGG